MRKLKEAVSRWWIFSIFFTLLLIPFFYIYLSIVLRHLLPKMQIIESLGYFPLITAEALRKFSFSYILNASLFYVFALSFFLGTLFWIGWVIKKRKYIYLLFLLTLTLFPFLNNPDSYRNLREGWLVRSEGGRIITNWYYSHTLLSAEGIKGFWEKEQKLVFFAGSPPRDFRKWAKRNDIIVKTVSPGEKSRLQAADIIFNLPGGIPWEGRKKTEEEILRVSPSLPIRILRTMLALSLFVFSPLYLAFFLITFIVFPFYYCSRNKIKFYLCILLMLITLFLFLPGKKVAPLPDSPGKLRDAVFSPDYYVSLNALQKIYQGPGDTDSILREILLQEKRWYIRYAIWLKLRHKGWDGKISSLEK
ncbi:MAG: hypothetical protein GXO71_05110 [Caldiserica bacterium]|nr:hypothetical protein [Caldisericota bacterium]